MGVEDSEIFFSAIVGVAFHTYDNLLTLYSIFFLITKVCYMQNRICEASLGEVVTVVT